MRWVCMQSRRLHCFFKDLEKSQKLSCTVSCVFLLKSLTGPSAAWRNQSGHFLVWPFLELWDGLKFVRTWHTHRHAAHRQTNRREQRMLLAFSVGRWCWLVANLARARRSLRNLWCRTFPRHIVVKTPSLMSLVNLFRSWCIGAAQQNAGRHLGARETYSGGTAGAENHLLRWLYSVFLKICQKIVSLHQHTVLCKP